MLDELAFDFRSDTVTQPDLGMKRAMSHAILGDDVFGEDPTVRALQEYAASLTGHEDGLFFPTGSMANLTALMCHAAPGTILFAGEQSHVKLYEMGSYARIAGLSLVEIDDGQGYLDLDQLRGVWPPDIYYMHQAGLISVENTHNMLGGRIYPEERLADLRAFARDKAIPIHMDGARLCNAARARGKDLHFWTRHVDSVMLSMSKGLGAPVGSVLTGRGAFIEKARSIRKLLGGGMRQSGVLAAAGIFAFEHNFPRLDQDHERCYQVYQEVRDLPWLNAVAPESNILVFYTEEPIAVEYMQAMAEAGVKLLALGPKKVRAVFHLHITDKAIESFVSLTRKWEPRK